MKDDKRKRGYMIAGWLLAAAGAINVATRFSSGNRLFLIAAAVFFLASIAFFTLAKRGSRKR
jgi:hypothetical protein